MSELMKRYKKEKFENNLPKEKITTKQIITLIISFLFLSSILFIIYVINHDIDIINLVKITELILKNPPLFIGAMIFVFTFIFGILTSIKSTNINDIFDVISSCLAVITIAFIFSVFSYFIVYVITFGWLVK